MRRGLGLVFLAMASLHTGHSYAKLVVVASAGPSSKALIPGAVLREPLDLRLKEGDFLSLLGDDGVRHFNGPGKVHVENLPARDASMFAKIQRLLAASKERRSVLAATRTMGERKPDQSIDHAEAPSKGDSAKPGLWQIGTEAGAWCVNDLEAVELWRPAAKDGTEFSITALEGGSHTARWTKGQNTTTWPDAIKIRDGSQYILRRGQEPETFLTLRVIRETPDTLPALMERLYELECDAQLQQIADR